MLKLILLIVSFLTKFFKSQSKISGGIKIKNKNYLLECDYSNISLQYFSLLQQIL